MDCGYDGPPFKWDEARRFQLRCELDALKSHFPTPCHAVAYFMDTFPIVRKKDIKATEQKDDAGNVTKEGTYRTKNRILALYDDMLVARREGTAWQSPLNPPPGPPTAPDGTVPPLRNVKGQHSLPNPPTLSRSKRLNAASPSCPAPSRLSPTTMIKHLKLKGFTLFQSANINFAKGLNVIIGSNGTGKSHLLKLAYTSARWSHEMSLRTAKQGRPDKATQQKELGGKLVRIFRPDQLGRLTSRGQGRTRAEVQVSFAGNSKAGFKFSFATNSSTDVTLDKAPEAFFEDGTVFLPTKEMLSMFPGFAALYDNVSIEIDETYADLCRALDRPLLRGPRFKEIDKLLTPLEQVLGGNIKNESGRFYLVQKGSGKFEISLVAEGFRKLGTVAYLLANGSLSDQSILFWDEPETNLNPAYLTEVAKLLIAVASNGTQVIIATHSLFLLRELSLRSSEVDSRFFALSETGQDLAAEWDKRATSITTGSCAEEIEPIAALEAEIEQSNRYLYETP